MAILKAGSGRVWTMRFGAGAGHTPYYHDHGVAGSPDLSLGDVTKIEVPSDRQHNQWITASEYQGSPDRASIPITVRLTTDRSELADLVRLRCTFDMQVHFGACEDPRDFNFGWDMIKAYGYSLASNYSTTEQGAMEGGDEAPIDEEITLSVRDIYTIYKVLFTAVAATAVSEEIVAVSVCDSISCGGCANPSDGCSIVMAVSNPAGSSPGILPQVIGTDDKYATIHERVVTSVPLSENVTDATCVGKYLVVVSEDGESHHYAEIQNIIDEDEVWAEVTGGYVAGNGPLAIWSYSPLATWVVGENGYIYFMDDPTAAVVVQDAGEATTENLNDVAGWNIRKVAAVGASNAFVYTLDGSTWSNVVGPEIGSNLLCLAWRNEDEIWVGTDAGTVYYTTDYGQHWVEVTGIPGTPTQIDDIKFSNHMVGWMAIRQAGPAGKILRTISGGWTWYIAPEDRTLAIPANDYINSIAICDEPNYIFAGGLSDGGADGILVRSSDY